MEFEQRRRLRDRLRVGRLGGGRFEELLAVPQDSEEARLVHVRTVTRRGKPRERYARIQGAAMQVVEASLVGARRVHLNTGVPEGRVAHPYKPTKEQKYARNPHEPIKI